MELGTGAGGQKQNDGANGLRKKFHVIFSRVDTIRQGDRRTDTRRQQRPRLRIASRGKNGCCTGFVPGNAVCNCVLTSLTVVKATNSVSSKCHDVMRCLALDAGGVDDDMAKNR